MATKVHWQQVAAAAWAFAEIFPGGGAKSILLSFFSFCLAFSGCWRSTQIDVYKKISNVMGRRS